MKRILPRLLIVAVVVLQLIWITKPRIGSSRLGPRARQAMEAYSASPTPERSEAIFKAMAQDGTTAGPWMFAPFVLIIAFDIALIYFFWNYGTRKTTA
jgi:hypothetical protein